MTTWILLALFLFSAWVVGGWWLDDRQDEAEYATKHPSRHTTRRPTVLIGDSK